jgi:hypothetical protein
VNAISRVMEVEDVKVFGTFAVYLRGAGCRSTRYLVADGRVQGITRDHAVCSGNWTFKFC